MLNLAPVIEGLETLIAATWTEVRHIEFTDIARVMALDLGLSAPFVIVDCSTIDVTESQSAVKCVRWVPTFEIYYVAKQAKAATTVRTTILPAIGTLAAALRASRWPVDETTNTIVKARVTGIMPTGGPLGEHFAVNGGTLCCGALRIDAIIEET